MTGQRLEHHLLYTKQQFKQQLNNKKTKIMSTVKVTTASNSTTEIIGVSTNNPEYGFIRVESTDGLSFGNGGWLNAKSKSALIKGKVADLRTFVQKNNVTVGYSIPGQIVVMEQAGTPFYEGQQPKRAGVDGEVLFVTKDGQRLPIYRQTEFTMDMNRADQLVQHENALSAAARVMTANDIAVK
jgi:hypothetical protein